MGQNPNQRNDIMRKYLIGILIGAALMFSASAYAADITSLIGKTVQGVFPVKVNGGLLPKTAIVIDGTSYLPVRSIGDAIGYDVSFNADLGIELKKKETTLMTTPAVNSLSVPISTPTEQVFTLEVIETEIRFDKLFIGGLEYNLQNSPDNAENKAKLKKYQDELSIWEARKAALSQ